MNKPEIIGYEPIPGHEHAPFLPGSLTLKQDTQGCYIIVDDGQHHYLITNDQRSVQRMRSWGFRPVYRPRDFHARYTPKGYRLRCRRCWALTEFDRYTTASEVHGVAVDHARECEDVIRVR